MNKCPKCGVKQEGKNQCQHCGFIFDGGKRSDLVWGLIFIALGITFFLVSSEPIFIVMGVSLFIFGCFGCFYQPIKRFIYPPIKRFISELFKNFIALILNIKKELSFKFKSMTNRKHQEQFILSTEDIKKKKLLGIIGSAFLFIGVFTPVLSIPIIGNKNYFQNGKGDGTIILVLAVISIVLTIKDKYEGLLLTGIGSLFVMAFSFINFQIRLSDIKAQMNYELIGNPFRGLADMAIQSVQIEWGWAVLLIGAALLIAAATMKGKQTS